MIMEQLTEFLPFVIPLAIAQYGLMAYAIYHILTHKRYKCGNRAIWLVVSILVNFIGPILYLTIGKEE